MVDYARVGGFTRKSEQKNPVPQSQPLRGREAEMEKNPAGGYGFRLDDFARAYRFMILGTDGGSFYVGEKDLTKQNIEAVSRAIESDPIRVVDTAVEILREGRAFKTDPALFVLALVSAYKVSDKNANGEAQRIRKYALDSAMKVIRQSTQLFHFLKFVQEMRGWGRGIRAAFANWYVTMPEDKLALQVTKYKSRDGVTHRDVLRLAHPKWPNVAKATSEDKTRSMILQYVARPDDSKFFDPSFRDRMLGKKGRRNSDEALRQIAAAEELLHITDTSKASVEKAVKLILDHGLTHEMVPGDLKNSVEVWQALAEHMPVMATLRNLGKMTQVGAIARLSDTEKKIAERLTNAEMIEKSRVHPLQVLIALRQYDAGRGLRGSLTWSPTPKIKDALDAAFPLAFKNVPVTGKRIGIAVDVSGSMTGASVTGMDGWTACQVAGVMALIHTRVEPNTVTMVFDGQARFEDNISARTTVAQALKLYGRNGGWTDTASPFRLLNQSKTDLDAVITYTDNCTWAGSRHVVDEHKMYVKKVGHPVRFINCATTAISTTDVDPGNADMYEMCGFDSAAPRVISDFIEGRF